MPSRAHVRLPCAPVNRLRAAPMERVAAAPKLKDEFYGSREWRALIARIVKMRGRRCQECGATHDPETHEPIRVYGDHVQELKDGGAPLDPSNVLLRCATCHGRKTAQERAKRMARRYLGP